MKQYEAVLKTLERLGGIATLAQLNQEVFKLKDCEWKTKTPFASIRRIVQTTKGIFKVRPGLYALEDYRDALLRQGVTAQDDSKDSNENKVFTHSYFQGILLTVGDMHGFDTFVPNQDKNKLFYDGRKLSEIATLGSLPVFSYHNLVRRSSTVDTIWLNERRMPHSFFEVEHSTDIQNSLLKFLDLQDFYARMVIVADNKRRTEFETKIRYSAFNSLLVNRRVSFLSYDSLIKQYEQELEKTCFEFTL